jgi:hypothetical protein
MAPYVLRYGNLSTPCLPFQGKPELERTEQQRHIVPIIIQHNGEIDVWIIQQGLASKWPVKFRQHLITLQLPLPTRPERGHILHLEGASV